MSHILKGFVAVQELQSNVPGEIAPLGELSVWSMTYTKDQNEFNDPSVPYYRLVSTSCKDTATGAIEPNLEVIKQALSMARAAVEFAKGNPPPYDALDLQQQLYAVFTGVATNIKLGPQLSNNVIDLPEWISWTTLVDTTIDPAITTSEVKIWLSDKAYAAQFDEFEITVIPPLSHIDDFFLPYNEIKAKLEAVTVTQLMDTIQLAKDECPETYTRVINFKYYSPVLTNPVIPVNWALLIYGIEGDNIDMMKIALVNYIMSHTTHTRAEWELIFPDIFKNTEFTILPLWHKMAVPDKAVQTGIYSPVVSIQDVEAFVKANIAFYSQEWMSGDVIVSVPHLYKSLSLLFVTGSTNDPSASTFLKVFSDYMAVPTTSTDFNRMTKATQDFVLLLEQMLLVAENIDKFLTIPDPLRIIRREGQRYVSVFYNNVEFLMALKDTYVLPMGDSLP